MEVVTQLAIYRTDEGGKKVPAQKTGAEWVTGSRLGQGYVAFLPLRKDFMQFKFTPSNTAYTYSSLIVKLVGLPELDIWIRLTGAY